jgi:hypothetical protein
MRISTDRTTRITVLISLAFLLKAVSSCIQPVFDFDFDFNKITVTNLDNSDVYVMRNDRDTMYSSAIAFEVTLSDEEFLAAGSLPKAETAFPGFTPATAMSPESLYHPRHHITALRIVTLEEMSPAIPAGSDVTGLFVAYVPRYSEGFLYIITDELLTMINRDFYPGEPSVSFQLFCNQDITASRVLFAITVTLSDESMLTAQTGIVNLLRAR